MTKSIALSKCRQAAFALEQALPANSRACSQGDNN